MGSFQIFRYPKWLERTWSPRKGQFLPSLYIYIESSVTWESRLGIRAGQINQSENLSQTRPDKNDFESIRNRLKYRIDLVSRYFKFWVLSEPNPNPNEFLKKT